MKTTHGVGPYLFGKRVRGLGAWLGRLYVTHNPSTGAPALLEVPTARTPHRVPLGGVRLLVTQWAGAAPGTAVEVQDGDPALAVTALDSAAELAEQSLTAPGVLAHLSQRRPSPLPEPGILVSEERLTDLLHSAEEVDGARQELAAVRAAHAQTARAALATHEEARTLRAEHARCASRARRGRQVAQGVAFAAAVALSLWPRVVRDPHVQMAWVEEGRGKDASTVALTQGADLWMGDSLSGTKVPRSPFDNQKRPPCTSDTEVSLNGGCWIEAARRAPCPANLFEHQGRCYVPVGKTQRPDTSFERAP